MGVHTEVGARLVAHQRENGAAHAGHCKVNAPAPLAKLAKQADRAAAFVEATHLADFAFEEAERFFGLPQVRLSALESWLKPLTSDEAEAQFLTRFNQLEKEITG